MFLRMVIQGTVVSVKAQLCYELHAKCYPPFFSQCLLLMYRGMSGVNVLQKEMFHRHCYSNLVLESVLRMFKKNRTN